MRVLILPPRSPNPKLARAGTLSRARSDGDNARLLTARERLLLPQHRDRREPERSRRRARNARDKKDGPDLPHGMVPGPITSRQLEIQTAACAAAFLLAFFSDLPFETATP